MINYQLSELLKPIYPDALPYSLNITGLSIDSRTTQPGDLFLAYAGTQHEGRQFIDDAIARGASAVLQEGTTAQHALKKCVASSIPMIDMPNLAAQIGHIAARFYDNPSQQMTIIGVTGTNGKTTTTQCIAYALELAGRQCGIIGTLGYGFPGHLQTTPRTTSDPISLQQQLAELKQQGAQAVAMEVSSHSLDQLRVAGIAFDIGVFTNLTQDHLDYHHTMANYAAAKYQLFLQPHLRYGVINIDDDYGQTFCEQLKNDMTIYGYSINHKIMDLPLIQAHKVHLHTTGFTTDMTTPWGDGILHSRLLGRFNISNLLAVVSVLGIMGIPLAQSLHYLAQVPPVTGRMQTVTAANAPLIVVDYAHTPDALEKALAALREHAPQRLWCVFGCGGDRDQSKRPLMAKIAEQYSDKIIVTNDNPRSEDPHGIAQDILAGFIAPANVHVELDRAAAIKYAISCADAEDIVLIAGKGHETYQIIGDKIIAFSDVEQVRINLQLRV